MPISLVPSFIHIFIPSFYSFCFPSFLPSFPPSLYPYYLPSFIPTFCPNYLPSFFPSFIIFLLTSTFPPYLLSFILSFYPSFFLRSFYPCYILLFFLLSDFFVSFSPHSVFFTYQVSSFLYRRESNLAISSSPVTKTMYIFSKAYCYLCGKRKFLAVRQVGLVTHHECRVDRPLPVT